MFRIISCVLLCVGFPLALHADDDFRQALDAGDVDVVKAMLDKDPSLLEKPISINASVKPSPLLYVVEKPNMLRLLLAAGADPDSDQASPLRSAIYYHNLQSVRILLDAGAKMEEAREHSSKRSSLEIAAEEGQLEIVKELLDRGLSVDDGQALAIATAYRHWNVVEFLLQRGADPNREGAFTTAAAIAPSEIVKLMLDHGADANTQRFYGGALALATGDLGKVKLLVSVGADVNGSLKNGDRPLHKAAEVGNLDVVAYLLNKNADVNVKKEDGQTPLDLAVRTGHAAVVKRLLDAGAERTLHSEVALGNVEQVISALNEGADVNRLIAGDYAPQLIHTAIKFEQIQMLKLLIDKGADVDAVIGDFSALHQAVSQRSIQSVKILLAAGADVNAVLFKRGYGLGNLTPLHLVGYRPNRFGIESELKVTSTSNEVELTIAQLLLDNGADLTLLSEYGETPLQAAKRLGKKHLVQLLEKASD